MGCLGAVPFSFTRCLMYLSLHRFPSFSPSYRASGFVRLGDLVPPDQGRLGRAEAREPLPGSAGQRMLRGSVYPVELGAHGWGAGGCGAGLRGSQQSLAHPERVLRVKKVRPRRKRDVGGCERCHGPEAC